MHGAMTYFGSIFNEINMKMLDVGTWYELFRLNCQKRKIYRYLWDVFLMLWTLLGLGRDKVSPRLTHDWFVCSTSIWTSNGLGFLGHISLTIFEKFLFYVVQYNINLHCKDTKSGKCCNIWKKKKKKMYNMYHF